MLPVSTNISYKYDKTILFISLLKSELSNWDLTEFKFWEVKH